MSENQIAKYDSGSSDANSSASMAKNYFQPLNADVNTRTGSLGITLLPPVLSSMVSMDIDLSVTYIQSSAFTDVSLFGLPNGWSYNLSYILNNRITINGSESYVLATSHPSGMQYYDLENLNLTSFSPGNYPVLPYDTSQKYAYLLSFSDGHHQYFDVYGKLICYDDKSGNHQLFYYSVVDANISKSKLIQVISVDGKAVNIIYATDEIKISYPTGGENFIQFSYKTANGNAKLAQYIDPVGDVTSIEYNGGLMTKGLISKITYPSQLVAVYDYSVMPYMVNGVKNQLDVVSKVTASYGGFDRVTTYNYNATGNNHNYLGFPTYNLIPGKDALLESNNNSYMYATTVDNGITKTTYQYNRLHLQLETRANASSDGTLVSKTDTIYYGEGGENYFPPFNQLPANYQYPKEQSTIYYNDNGQSITFKTVTEYNVYGQTTKLTEYQEDNGSLKVTKETDSTYDSGFGVLLEEVIKDYMPQGIIVSTPTATKTLNSLTSDKKQIALSQFGSYNNSVFVSETNTGYEYDAKGRITSKQLSWTDANGKEGIDKTGTTYAYPVNEGTGIFTKKTIDYEGNALSENYDLASGFLLSRVDALGNKEVYTYDNLGRMTSLTNAVGAVTKWEYVHSENKMVTTSQNGYVACEYYNGFGDSIKKTDFPVKNGKERILEMSAYNDLGQLVDKSGVLGNNSRLIYSYDKRGLLASKTDAQGNVTSYTYDVAALSRVTFINGLRTQEELYNNQKKVIQSTRYNTTNQSLSSLSSKGYNALESNVSVKAGTAKEHWMEQRIAYDVFNNPIEQVNTGFDGISQVNKLTLDLLNNVLSSTRSLSTDSGTKTSATQVYNSLSQLIEEITQLKKTKTYDYDKVGNVLTTTNFEGDKTEQTYYADNKLKTRSYTDSDGHNIRVEYTYDANANLLVKMEQFNNETSDSVLAYNYSLDGLLTAISYPDGKTLSWNYDENGFLTQLTDAVGQKTDYSYDPYGQLTKIANQSLAVSVDIAYYGKEAGAISGQVKSVSYSNGVRVNFTYSGFNLISQIDINNAGNQLLLSVAYTYDTASGNILSIQYRSELDSSERLNYDINYTYNGINQLIADEKKDTAGKLIVSTAYSYDASGNILSKTLTDSTGSKSTKYSYDAEDKLIEIENAGNKTSLIYDTNNNLVKDGDGNLYAYNVLNQLISFTSSSGVSAQYTYYPNGLRSGKTIKGAETITYYYDNEDDANIVNEIQGGTSASYLMLKATRFVRLYNDGSKTDLEFLMQNSKDVLLVVDEKGNINSSYNYTAYGESDAAESDYSIKSNPFRYNKEYADAESGLYYLRSRYYSPKLMCFISWDSIVIFNHYAYANGNPIMNIDPSGHLSFWAILGIVVVAVAVVAASIAAAVFTLGASAVVEGAGAAGAAAGGGIGAMIAGEGSSAAVAGAAAGSAIASGGAAGAISGAAGGALIGSVAGLNGAAVGAAVGGAGGAIVGLGTAAVAEGTAATIGAAIGATAGGYLGAAGGAALGGAVAGEFGATIGAVAGGAIGGFTGTVVGGATGAAIGATLEAGAVVTGGIVGAASTAVTAAGTAVTATTAAVSGAITGTLDAVSAYLFPTIAISFI